MPLKYTELPIRGSTTSRINSHHNKASKSALRIKKKNFAVAAHFVCAKLRSMAAKRILSGNLQVNGCDSLVLWLCGVEREHSFGVV